MVKLKGEEVRWEILDGDFRWGDVRGECWMGR